MPNTIAKKRTSNVLGLSEKTRQAIADYLIRESKTDSAKFRENFPILNKNFNSYKLGAIFKYLLDKGVLTQVTKVMSSWKTTNRRTIWTYKITRSKKKILQALGLNNQSKD